MAGSLIHVGLDEGGYSVITLMRVKEIVQEGADGYCD